MATDVGERLDLDSIDAAEDSSFVRKLRSDLSSIPDLDRSGFSPLMDTSSRFGNQVDVSQFRIQLKQLKLDLQSEQDMVAQLRKRLNTSEKERLESASKANNEMSALESQLARIRSQIEKGEAMRHNLEFELTKAKRDLLQQKQQSRDRESHQLETKDELKQKLHDVTDEMRELQKQTQAIKQEATEVESRLKYELDQKNQLILKYQSEHDVLRAERDKLNSMLTQQQSTLCDVTEKFQDLESDRKSQADGLQRALSELEYSKERELAVKQDIETLLHKLKSFEDSVEAERAAHLETKFNSEILQLRIRDLEGGIEVEQSANIEATKAIEGLTKQLRELEQLYDDEKRMRKEVGFKLEKIEKEYMIVRQQLSNEVENKKNIIHNMSKELEIHQKNFNDLKDELGKAKKRQLFLENTYGDSMKELDLILRNFQPEDKAKKPKLTKDTKVKKIASPSVLLESLRYILHEFKKDNDHLKDELSKSKKICEKVTKELDSAKEMIMAKDKSLEDAQKNYTRTARELNRVRAEASELEAMLSQLKFDLQSSSSSQDKDRNRIMGLSEEIMKLVKKHRGEDEEKLAFMHGMYQRLVAGRIVLPVKDKGFNQFSWSDLTEVVYQQVTTLVNTLQQTDDKMRHLEEMLESRDVTIGDMQATYEDQLNKLTRLTKEREAAWSKQKEEIETHYSQLLADLQTRSKKSQVIADQAWEKIRASGSVQHGLESECSELQKHLVDAQTQNAALKTTCGLLAGAIYPLYSRANELAAERRALEEQTIVWDACRERAQYLVNVLNSEMTDEIEKPERDRRRKEKKNPLLRFRISAVAVIAANRLNYFGRHSCKMFVTYDTVSGSNGLLVCTGGVKQERIPFKGVGRSSGDESDLHSVTDQTVNSQLLPWLTGSTIADIAVDSVSEFQEVASQIRERGPVETRALIGAARSSFSKLLDKIGQQFPSISLQPMAGLQMRSSLIRVLGRGLSQAMVGKSFKDKQCLISSQDLMIALQNHILDFTHRLRNAEVNRKRLLAELNTLKQQIQSDSNTDQDQKHENREDSEQTLKYVTLEKFERVCSELNKALQREQQAQHLLHEQSQQMEELTVQLDVCSSHDLDKDSTLEEAVQGLSEAKTELRRREQVIRQLNRQNQQVTAEKRSYQDNLRDVEGAMHNVVKDKEILAKYLKSVEAALKEARQQLSVLKDPSRHDLVLSKMLLNADFIPTDIGKAGPELIACQNLVGAFIDTYHQAVSKIKLLEDEIESHRQHVATIKRELSDAVRRECNDQFTVEALEEHDIIPSVSEIFSSPDEFVPLKEDSEKSYSMSSRVSSTSKSSKTSPKKTIRSMQYQTAHRNQRPGIPRPKPKGSGTR
ncbi:coiled-coil domain-containing protein 171-like isoform X2 [Gigantopelta aegis]|nr:coiled-coil domain-containing protein 171-like isoform X2 [Gigantopelta aegis]